MKGKVFLGVISGFMFGLFLGPTLWLWGVIPFSSPLIWILPLVGIVLGMLMAAWAPFGKGPAPVVATAGATAASTPTDADEPEAEAAADTSVDDHADDHSEEE